MSELQRSRRTAGHARLTSGLVVGHVERETGGRPNLLWSPAVRGVALYVVSDVGQIIEYEALLGRTYKVSERLAAGEGGWQHGDGVQTSTERGRVGAGNKETVRTARDVESGAPASIVRSFRGRPIFCGARVQCEGPKTVCDRRVNLAYARSPPVYTNCIRDGAGSISG